MSAILGNDVQPAYKIPFFERWSERVNRWCRWRWLPLVLFVLGLLRGLAALLAYPPAHVQDSFVYLFYAQRLGGADIPGLGELVPPLYPLMLLVTYVWFDSLYLQIIVQWLMSAALAPLYYAALRPLNPVMALLVAGVVLFDFQTATAFNFIATEPLYIFLLAVAFFLFMRQRPSQGIPWAGDFAAGGVVVLLMLTRAVARLLFVPLAILFALKTRSLRRTGALIGGYGGVFLLFTLLSLSSGGENAGAGSSNYMLLGVLLRHPEWVSAENGANSAEYLEIQQDCQDLIQRCYEARHGTIEGLGSLITGAAIETIRAQPFAFIELLWRDTDNFLGLSAQQLGIDEDTPAAAQCRNLESLDALTPEQARFFSWSWGMEQYIAERFDDFKAAYIEMRHALCPPTPASPVMRDVVDWLMFRYRSLGRPDAYLWYGALVVLTLVWHRARRYWYVLLVSLAILLNHALISALLSNIQPRYVLVTNPFRALLLVLLGFVVLDIGLHSLDWFLARRRAAKTTTNVI